ncbi:MAG TPA: DUF2711 family protein, partial [Ktedonobacterales bacterium]|nr:DUF2711 family protein [Ktedonobacterales bacterium]
MQFEQFTYPSYEAPLLDAYGHRFEAAYVVLHPFVRVPEELSWKATRQYPGDEQILARGKKCPWEEVTRETGLGNCARLNQALLTSIGSVADHLCDYAGRDRLQSFLQEDAVWMPSEGRFEPLLQRDMLAAFEQAGARELVYVPEFPQSDPVVRLSVPELRDGTMPFPPRGSLVDPAGSFLFTVDWDSFFTLFYGTREFIGEVAGSRGIEG